MSRFHDFYFFSIILMIVVLSSGKEHYCELCAEHTMCLYKDEKPICKSTSYNITPKGQNQIVNVHNEFRQKVASGNESRGKPGPQPAAKDMPNLVWDKELAIVAQRWANQCQFKHDKCRKVKRFNVGQNLAWWKSSLSSNDPGLENLVRMWYNEVDLFDSKHVTRVTNLGKVGHYTQVLWAKTTTVGCGYVMYVEGDSKIAHLICNYGPAGNFVSGKMYDPIPERQMTNQQTLSVDTAKVEPEKKVNEQEELQKVVLHASKIFIPLIKSMMSVR